MANIHELKPVHGLKKFKHFCITIGNLPSSYLESMTYYEMLNWFCDYLQNTVIPTVNNNAESVLELQNLYVQLKNYVDNYFTNLDVQEEINNKLDEMTESGELTNLISTYVNPFIDEQNEQINNFIEEQNEQINNFIEEQNVQFEELSQKVDVAVSGSPLVANSVSEMTNTERVYVNTTDGCWYYYDGTNWINGGTYQATQLNKNSVLPENLSDELQNDIYLKTNNLYGNFEKVVENRNFQLVTAENGGYYNITRSKPINYNGYIRKIFIRIHEGLEGALKLQRLQVNNNSLSVIEEDSNIYQVTGGNNEILLTEPFEVMQGDYIGFTMTSPANIDAVNNNSSPLIKYGLIANRYSDHNMTKIDTFIPCFDFTLETKNTFEIENKIENPEIAMSPLYGKKWVAFGDSITAGWGLENYNSNEGHDNNNNVEVYAKIIADKYNMEYHNEGRSARSYSLR